MKSNQELKCDQTFEKAFSKVVAQRRNVLVEELWRIFQRLLTSIDRRERKNQVDLELYACQR